MVFFISTLFFIVAISLLFIIRKIEYRNAVLFTELFDEVKKLSLDVQKIFVLTDMLQSGLCHPVFKSIYSELRTLPADKIPRNNQQFAEIFGKISNEKFLKITSFFQDRINGSEDSDEREFFESKLSKLNEIKTLIDMIGSDSSMEHIELIHTELEKSLQEFNGG